METKIGIRAPKEEKAKVYKLIKQNKKLKERSYEVVLRALEVLSKKGE